MNIVENSIIRVTFPNQIAETIVKELKNSEVINDNGDSKEIAFYWGQHEAQCVTKVLDSSRPEQAHPEIAAPILRDYQWPGVFSPFAHQRVTAAYLSLRPRAFCFNEAGTGKTSAAIWAADYLMNLGVIRRVLVVCPLSIMYSAWQADIFKTAMHRTCGVAHGSSSKRHKILEQNYDFVIINYDGVHVAQDAIAQFGFDLIIVDEANAYKSTSTKRWKTLAKLITPRTWLWMMTGTPASQSPEGAYGLAKLVSPERVPKFATAWRDYVMTQLTRFKWAPRYDSREKVFKALQPAIRFAKKDCLDLPELVYQTRVVPMSLQAKKYYDELKQQYLITAADEQVSAVNAAAVLNKLLQISGGAVYTDTRGVVGFDINPRLAALGEVLDETSNKVLVFVPYRHTIPIVSQYLIDSGHSTEVISGDVSARERAEIINRFQTQTDPQVLVIQPQAASHGVTLTAADTIVFWSPVMSVETYLQCIGRIERVGQKHNMTVVHLQGSAVEQRVYSMLGDKVNNHGRLVELYKQEMEEV